MIFRTDDPKLEVTYALVVCFSSLMYSIGWCGERGGGEITANVSFKIITKIKPLKRLNITKTKGTQQKHDKSKYTKKNIRILNTPLKYTNSKYITKINEF